MSGERRKTPRLTLEKPAAAKVHTCVSGRVLEIGSKGLSMTVRKPMDVGSAHALRLSFPEGGVEVSGVVRRCSLTGFETDENADRVRVYKAAIEFQNAPPELLERLRGGVPLQVEVD